MGSDEIHPWALRELGEEVAKPLAIVFEKTKQNIHVFLGREIGKTQGTTGW